jgi:hypothetical protein
MNGPPSQPEIKPNQTARQGSTCLNRLASFTPSHPKSSFRPLPSLPCLFSSPSLSLTTTSSSFFHPLLLVLSTSLHSLSSCFLRCFSSTSAIYLHPLFNPNTLAQSASLDLLILCSPTPCKKRRPLTSKEPSKALANTIFISSNLHVTFADVSSFDFDLKILVYILRRLNLSQEFC